MMNFKVLKEPFVKNLNMFFSCGSLISALHCVLQPKQVFRGKACRYCFKSKLFDGSGAVKPWATRPFVSLCLPTGVLFLCNYRAIGAQLQHQQRCVMRWLNGLEVEALQLPSLEATVTNLW